MKRIITIITVIVLAGLLFSACQGIATMFHGEKPPVQYTVIFHGNGANGTAPEEQTVDTGTEIVLPAEGTLSYTGKSFSGWSQSPSGATETYAAASSYIVNATVTLYAQWVNNFTVTFYAGDGATGTPPAAKSVGSGTVITMPTAGGLSRAGYAFTGWNVSIDGSGGITYPAGANYTVTTDIDFYAQWIDNTTPKYAVTYNANGASGGTAPTAVQVYQGMSATVAGAGTLVNGTKTFNGWNTASDGSGTAYSEGDSITVTANITLYAQWLDPDAVYYTVTYNANGGTGTAPSEQTVESGKSITVAAQGSITNSGKTFNGWNTNAGGTGTAYAAGASITVTANITLYAQWLNAPIEPEGSTLAEKFAWIASQMPNGAVYNITIDTDTSLAPTTLSTMGQNVIINLRSASAEDIKTISISSSTGSLFIVSSNITLKMENVTLKGSRANNASLIQITSGGRMEMYDGVTIKDNYKSVYDGPGGGGLCVDNGGLLTIYGGTITGNTIYSESMGMGGAIYIRTGGTVNMRGGVISGNNAIDSSYAGNDGVGGGIYVEYQGHFVKAPISPGESCGVIYGQGAGSPNANTTGSNTASVIYMAGQYYYSTPYKRNTTLSGFDEISSENINAGWE
ncbi:MAG: InlB B-repeat-containing protein [Spirochaetaceae bacterium]|jgi:uncharacterized repeat protein (TIGR02543 family)|nr:InlB B-repeat-containing protein [Spirochaetaceae bacterium]